MSSDLTELQTAVWEAFDELLRARSRLGMVDSTRNADRQTITEQRQQIARLQADWAAAGLLTVANQTIMERLRRIFLEPGDHIQDIRVVTDWLRNTSHNGFLSGEEENNNGNL